MAEEFISKNPHLFTGKEKTFLRPGEYFNNSQILFSPDGAWRLFLWSEFGGHGSLFIARIDPDKHSLYVTPWWEHFGASKVENYAILQTDGNFCIYEGIDPQHKGRLLWQTGTHSGKSAVMQADGNFCIYNHEGSTYKPGCIIWQAGYNTGAVDHYEFTDLIYDYNHMTRLDPTIETAFSQVIKNKSSKEQKTEVTFQIKTTEKHSWQTSSSSKLGIKASTQISIPIGVKIGFEISGEFTESSAQGKETSTEKTTTYSVPVVIPPMKAMKVDACITNSSIKLPYRSEGVFALKSGSFSYCELTGTFVAKSGTELNVYYQELDLPNQEDKQEIYAEKHMIDGLEYQVSYAREFLAAGEPIRMNKSLIR